MNTTAIETYTQTSEFRQTDLTGYNDSYMYAIKPFVSFLDGGDVTIDSIREYFRELNTTDLAASTIRVRRQAVKDRVRRKFEHADPQTREHIESSFRSMDRDPDLKCPSSSYGGIGDNAVLSETEYATVLQKARSEKQRLFVSFLMQTGARVSEMTGVRHSDCKPEAGAVSVRLKGKGNKNASYKERTVYISETLYSRMLAEFGTTEGLLMQTRNGKRYSRSYVSNQISKLTMYAIGRKISAHKLRHSFATHQIQKHGRLSALSQYLGHSDVSITAKYYLHDKLSPADVLGPNALGGVL